MRLLLTGGGTLGSVTPLIAIAESLPRDAEVFWIGTHRGVEREVVRRAQIPYTWIVSTKLRRYVDLRTLAAPFLLVIGCIHALVRLLHIRPTHVMSAGGYVAVPVIWAAWFLRIPAYTIQLDVLPGLANHLVVPFVQKVFLTFEESVRFFPVQRVIVSGAPVRRLMRENIQSVSRPMVLSIGGGTGSQALNELIWSARADLAALCDVVHLTGVGKGNALRGEHYEQKEIAVEEMSSLYMRADVIITRAGMGTLSELAALSKAAIVIPLPNSPQEANARVLVERDAILLREQKGYAPEQLVHDVRTLLTNDKERQRLGVALHTTLPTKGVQVILQAMISS